MLHGDAVSAAGLRIGEVARMSGYSAQQVRDLDRLGVIPAARRSAGGYRVFGDEHLVALRAYRGLAGAVGPVVARRTMADILRLPLDRAAAVIGELHVGLAREREDALAALRALRMIAAEASGESASIGDGEGSSLSITTLADALAVRTSTLRFWEQEGLVSPERVTSLRVRSFPPAAVREARIVAALRASGYRIADVRETIRSIRRLDKLEQTVDALQGRLDAIAHRSLALLEAGADLVQLIRLDDASR